jgi:hypothetical protein
MALFAMLTGIAMPAHAHARQARTGAPGTDFCTTVKPGEALAGNSANSKADAPAAPEHHHAVQCDTCCGCGGVAAAPATPGSWPPLATAHAVPACAPATRQPAVAGFALARGPPNQS